MKYFTDLRPLFFLLVFMSGCSSVDIQDYADKTPKLVFNQFFNGQLSAHGIVKNTSGALIRTFNADIKGSWDQQGVGTLEEDFIFDDGEQQTRIWTFIPVGDGEYQASANDVTGSTVTETAGNALFMQYILQIEYQGKPMEISIDDRMYLINDSVLINESIMSKFGFDVGSFTLTIVRHD